MRLYLADLKDMSEAKIKEHLAEEYSIESPSVFVYNYARAKKHLDLCDVLVAYEEAHYEGNSWFLLREKATGDFFEFTGGHASWEGFSGQYRPDRTDIVYLNSDKFWGCGGLMIQGGSEEGQVRAFFAALAIANFEAEVDAAGRLSLKIPMRTKSN